ncbi:glutamate--cysteine ligase [Cumulibacter manganitolerans]|uniref:glutamate--cysteine ligase n=1 Tax=Cumulibacter manganitolerans TaxID=1884992 RepID=UPI001297108E|nr:glutamate--cysteine ligase [Cumulibacter manganitolerans]
MDIPFNPSAGPTLGVEWELELVDLKTRELTSRAVEILGDITPEGAAEHPRAKHELLQSCIEVITGICDSVEEATSQLAATVAEVQAAADPYGIGLMCSGTHPTSDFREQDISPKERYADLIENMQYLARRMAIFGVHVHVGVTDKNKVIPIVNALTQYVPHFLAFSASSPFWIGEDTGMASYRSKIFESLPTAGLPYQLDSWAEFELYMETLVETKSIRTIREVWWDIRPHPNFGTIELRICDGLPSLEEIGAVTALSQCLVTLLDREIDRGYQLPKPRQWLVRENKWRAARFGMDAEIVVDNIRTLRPVRESLLGLVEELMPTAKRLGCVDELGSIETILDRGASYQRQRARLQETGKMSDVVDLLLGEMRDGLK